MADMEHAIARLDELEGRRELTIIKLSDSILASIEGADEKRGSDASSTSAGQGMTTPATYEAELSHYKDLFTKLRFQYVEQVTKEKFLNAIIGDEPLNISAAQNAQLDADVASMKASLKAQKQQVEALVAELEQRGRELARRHYAVQLQSQELRQLPSEIQGLQQAITQLREEQGLADESQQEQGQSLPLAETLRLVEQRQMDMELLDQQLEAAEAASARKARELERLEDELVTLGAQKKQATSAASEAVRRKEEGTGGPGDETEGRGRWLRGVQTTMQSLLEVQ